MFVTLASSVPSPEYRTYVGLTPLLLLFGILPFVYLEKIRNARFLAVFASLLMFIGTWYAHAIVKTYIAVPDEKEMRYIVNAVREGELSSPNYSGVLIIRIIKPVAPGKRREIGEPNAYALPNVLPMVRTALSEAGVKRDVRIFACYPDTVASVWDEMILDRTDVRGRKVPPQANTIIIDMNRISSDSERFWRSDKS